MLTKANSASNKPPGAPRWTYMLGSLVGAAGLLWGIVSYFISNPESGKVGSAASVPKPAVTVSGSGSVGVGTMSGGQISLGSALPTPASAASTAKP